MSFAWEKFHGAMYMIANTGSIQKRLADAYIYHLKHIHDDALPPEIKDDFKKLRVDLTSVKPAGTEDPVVTAVEAMSEAKAYENIMKIIRMYNILAKDETPLP
ncbi:MAG: hypothetical protein A2234_00360 [Elusimicrobia bacterium RIFOXYA2_FULL_58_8]|nr:MAG: hypothetical protein A2234_00360 [Elusimicrobia bacterium RIFOXYA2_FULL_58_8]